jgi:hypothetical protein
MVALEELQKTISPNDKASMQAIDLARSPLYTTSEWARNRFYIVDVDRRFV